MPTTVPVRRVEDLSYLLAHTSHVLATQLSAAMAGLGITPRGYGVLFHAMQAERTQIQLAEIADLDKTTMVGTVDELERAGLAERRPSGTDRRARIIVVTEAGRPSPPPGKPRGCGNAVAGAAAMPQPRGPDRDARIRAGGRRSEARSTGARPGAVEPGRGCWRRGRAGLREVGQASRSSTKE
jgi:DNA-binding MarR family transcriptional regulator